MTRITKKELERILGRKKVNDLFWITKLRSNIKLGLKQKYGNVRVIYDWINFHSKKECARYQELKILE